MPHPPAPEVDALLPHDLSFPADELDALRATLAAMPDSSRIRGMFSSVARPAVAAMAPHALARFDRWQMQLPTASPFAWVPLREPLALGICTAHLLTPELDAVDAFNRFVERAIDRFFGLPAFLPILKACEGEVDTFARVFASSSRLIYDPGTIDIESRGPRHLTVHYEDIVPTALEFYANGFWRGVLGHFGHPVEEVGFTILDDRRCESTVRW